MGLGWEEGRGYKYVKRIKEADEKNKAAKEKKKKGILWNVPGFS